MNIVKDLIWIITMIFLIYSSFLFLKITRFYIFRINKVRKVLNSDKSHDSSIKALFMSLAAKVGVGSIAGVAVALYIGGPGTIFWMWIITALTSITTFVESYLGSKYKGGPSLYIKKGLNKKNLSRVYSIMLIFVYIIGFNTIQVNTITKLVNIGIYIPPLLIGIVLAIITFMIIKKTNNYIIDFISKLVPIMVIIYIFVTSYIIIKNIDQMYSVIKLIVLSGINIKSIEIPLYSCIIIGIQRGIFCCEAGTGTGAIAASISSSKNSIKVALIQTIGVMFTTFVICTFTAIIFIMSNYELKFADFNGIELASFSFSYHLGDFGNIVLFIIIFLFSFSTIISGYYFGESNFIMLNNKKSNICIFLFKIFTVIIIVSGSVVSSSLLWILADIFLASMTLINIYALIKLKSDIITEFNKKR